MIFMRLSAAFAVAVVSLLTASAAQSRPAVPSPSLARDASTRSAFGALGFSLPIPLAGSRRSGRQYLFVANESDGGVYIYRIGAPKLWHHIGRDHGVTCAVNFITDPQGDLFAQCDYTVKEYAWPYTGMPIATIRPPGTGGTRSMAMDQNNTLFFVNYSANLAKPGSVLAYRPPYTGMPSAIFATSVYPGAIAAAPNGTVFVSSFFGTSRSDIVRWDPPYTQGKTIISYPAGFAALTLDRCGNLWVGGNFTISGFAPPYTGKPFVRLRDDEGPPLHRYIVGPVQLLIDQNLRLFWINKYAGIRMLTPPYTGPAETINDAGKRIPNLYQAYYASGNIYYAFQTLALDADGALFVAAGPILKWTGDYHGVPVQITDGLPAGAVPGAVYVGPQPS